MIQTSSYKLEAREKGHLGCALRRVEVRCKQGYAGGLTAWAETPGYAVHLRPSKESRRSAFAGPVIVRENMQGRSRTEQKRDGRMCDRGSGRCERCRALLDKCGTCMADSGIAEQRNRVRQDRQGREASKKARSRTSKDGSLWLRHRMVAWEGLGTMEARKVRRSVRPCLCLSDRRFRRI